MILVIAATELEMKALRQFGAFGKTCKSLVTGVGLVSTTLYLTKYLCSATDCMIDGVIQFGVGGAYYIGGGAKTQQPQLLDICVPESEVLGDLGICMGDSVEYLTTELTGTLQYNLASEFSKNCLKTLDKNRVSYLKGVFITANAASGKRVRGAMLQKRWNGLCENMEGAAAAQVCDAFSVPFFQIRCISNMVEDRNPANWCLQEACDKAARVTATLLQDIA